MIIENLIQLKNALDYQIGTIGLIAILILVVVWMIAWTVVPFIILAIHNQNKKQTKILTFLANILGGNRDDLL